MDKEDNAAMEVPGFEFYGSSIRFTEEQFRRELRNFLDREQITNLDDSVIGDLFQITSQCVVEASVGSKLRTLEAKKDWAARYRLIVNVCKQLDQLERLLEKNRNCKLPATEALAAKLSKKFQSMWEAVDRAEVQQRAGASTAKTLRKRQYPRDLSLALNDFLEKYIPQLATQKQRDIVIAGCSSAASFYPKKEEEVVSRVKMQVSRSRKHHGDEPRTVFRPGRLHKR